MSLLNFHRKFPTRDRSHCKVMDFMLRSLNRPSQDPLMGGDSRGLRPGLSRLGGRMRPGNRRLGSRTRSVDNDHEPRRTSLPLASAICYGGIPELKDASRLWLLSLQLAFLSMIMTVAPIAVTGIYLCRLPPSITIHGGFALPAQRRVEPSRHRSDAIADGHTKSVALLLRTDS